MLKVFLKSVCAGTLIGVSALTFLSVTNPIIGALLFSFGLITIIVQDYYLYTGKIGKLKKTTDIPLLFTILIGNFIGAFGLGLVLSWCGICLGARAAAITLCTTKVTKTLFQSFLLSIGCGAIMETAVTNYAKTHNIFLVSLCVMIFILCGFEHCVANMFYFAFANQWSFSYIISNIIGNTIGAIAMNKFENL